MTDDTYTVFTPYGIVRATFPEDAGIVMDGHEDAVAAVRRAILASIDERGMTTTPEALDPDRFVQWCQGPDSAITIIPPALDGMDPVPPPLPEEADMQAAAALALDAANLSPEQADKARRAYEETFKAEPAPISYDTWAGVWAKAIGGIVSEGSTIHIHDGVEELPGMRAAIAAATNPLERIALVKAMKAAQAAWAAEQQDAGLTREEYQAVANTILQQLGGNKFKVMTGAKNFAAITRDSGAPNGGLSFQLPSGLSQINGKGTGINRVVIRLNASDTYDVEFASSRGMNYTVKATATDIYADVLREVFTRYTGLDTSLGSAGPKPTAAQQADWDTTAAVLAERARQAEAPAKYPDGRTIPTIGSKVYDRVAGMFGMPAVIQGEVAQGKNGLIVRITGGGDVLGSRVTTKTTPLTPSWTIVGEEHPAETRARVAKERADAENERWRSEREAGLVAAMERNGTLDPAAAKLGDVLEMADGELVYVNEKGADGALYVKSIKEDGPYHGGSLGIDFRGIRLRPDVKLPTDGSITIRLPDDTMQALYPRGWVKVEWSDEAYNYMPVDQPQPTGPYPFRYALVNRPADLGTVPKGVAYTVEPRPAAGQPHADMARHGILTTERELTAEEVKAFELAPLVEGDDLGVMAEAIARGMSEYAAAYLEQATEDPAYFKSRVMEGSRESASGIRYSIGDPEALVAMVRDKLAAMVPAEPAGGDQLATDRQFLTEVAEGKHPAMLEPELADDIEAAMLRHPGDADLQALGERAIIAYSNGLMAAT